MIAAEDYARAERLLWDVLRPQIKNKDLEPHWIGACDRFWYRRDTDDGHEYVVVDAAEGVKRPLFDHAALADALKTQFGETDITAATLALGDLVVAPDLGFFTFTRGIHAYRCVTNPLRCEQSVVEAVPHEWSVSPDGRMAVFSRDGNLWVHLISSGAEHRLTSDGEPDNGYGIYPDNWKAAFIPRLRTGKPFPPFGAQWAPDSSRLIAPHVDQRHVASYPFLESAPQDGSYRPKAHMARIPLAGEKPPIVTWHAFDMRARTRREIAVPSDLLFVHQDILPIQRSWWSADCRHRYMLAHTDNMSGAILLDADLETGSTRKMIEEHLAPRMNLNGVSYNPPNVWLSADARVAIWYSERDGWAHLYLYDTATGALKNRITTGAWNVRDIIDVDPERRQILFTGCGREGGNPYYRTLYRVGFEGGEPVRLTHEPLDQEIAPPEGDVVTRQISPSGRYIVHALSTVEDPPRSVIRELDTGRVLTTLEKADISAALDAGMRLPECFSVKAADGTSDLYGALYLPKDADPCRAYPVVIAQYTTPIGPAAPKTFIRGIAGVTGPVTPVALASLGFVVVTLDPRGTGYRSRDINNAIDERLNIIGMDDYAAAIRQLAKRFAYIDAERVGIFGGSYGGYAVIRAMLEYPEVFKVGIAAVPASAFHNMYPDYHWYAYHGKPVYADGGPWRIGPTDRPVNYENANSNVQVSRLAGKLLIVFGELDENVLPGTTLQFIAALIEDDRPFDMLILPNANHSTASRTRHYVRRHFDYFVQHLKGECPPVDFRFTLKPQEPEPGPGGAIW